MFGRRHFIKAGAAIVLGGPPRMEGSVEHADGSAGEERDKREEWLQLREANQRRVEELGLADGALPVRDGRPFGRAEP